MYQLEKLVSTSHVGSDGKLTLTSAVDFMQDCSSFHISSLQKLNEEFARKNMFMLIIFRQMDIIKMPKLREKLLVKTWTWELNRVFGSRNTVIYNEQGETCLIANVMGSFVFIDSGQPAQVSEEILQSFSVENKLDMEYLPRKIEIPAVQHQILATVPVLKSHLDHYNHVNNAKYVMIAYEYIPDAFIPRRLRVEYKVPAKYGDTFYPVIYREENKQIICLNNHDGKPFSIVEFSK